LGGISERIRGEDSMFVQTISFSTGRIDEIQKMAQEYEAQQEGQARGYIRSVTLKDRDRENAYMVHVEFESYELAMQKSAGQNSRRSEFTTVQESGPHVWNRSVRSSAETFESSESFRRPCGRTKCRACQFHPSPDRPDENVPSRRGRGHVREGGVEPPRPFRAPDPKSGASTGFRHSRHVNVQVKVYVKPVVAGRASVSVGGGTVLG
jgi:hypothetical protein